MGVRKGIPIKTSQSCLSGSPDGGVAAVLRAWERLPTSTEICANSKMVGSWSWAPHALEEAAKRAKSL